uniref:Uncharacterized protein n=1 Tax=Bracon brevicornis TaxID=1563983 RepID=A0A6V7IHS6_9HYME
MARDVPFDYRHVVNDKKKETSLNAAPRGSTPYLFFSSIAVTAYFQGSRRNPRGTSASSQVISYLEGGIRPVSWTMRGHSRGREMKKKKCQIDIKPQINPQTSQREEVEEEKL